MGYIVCLFFSFCPISPCLLLNSLLCLNSQRLLVSLIESRLRSLEDMRAPLQTEMEENAVRGKALETLVRERCLPVELERYILFIGDLERVVSLLLCLSARLARVQNALSTVDQHTDAEEKVSPLDLMDQEFRNAVLKQVATFAL